MKRRTALPGPTLDAGALIALDRHDRSAWLQLRALVRAGRRPVVPAPVVAQVWRSPRQAQLSRALRLCRVEPTDEALAREAGELCASTRSADAVDAIVVASAARRTGSVVTADLDDIGRLAAKVRGVTVVRVGATR